MSLMEAVEQLCENAKVIIDVGAKHGEFASALATFAPAARIFAFEPEPKNFDKLVLTTAMIPNVVPVNIALDEKVGQRKLHCYLHQGSHSFFFPDMLDESGPISTVSVKTVTLDAFCEEREIEEIDLLKIDVEGAELSVLKGAAGLLNRGAIDVVVVELMFFPYFVGQSDPDEIMTFMGSYDMMYMDAFYVMWEGVARYANVIFVQRGGKFDTVS